MFLALEALADVTGGQLVESSAQTLAIDSREVKAGDLLAAFGSAGDGHDFAPQALAAGASALLTERELEVLPQLVVADVPEASGVLVLSNGRHLRVT